MIWRIEWKPIKIFEKCLYSIFFFFYAKINTKNEILEPSNFEDSKLFIIKFFVTRNSGIIRIMINLTYENLCKEHLTFYEINEIIAIVGWLWIWVSKIVEIKICYNFNFWRKGEKRRCINIQMEIGFGRFHLQLMNVWKNYWRAQDAIEELCDRFVRRRFFFKLLVGNYNIFRNYFNVKRILCDRMIIKEHCLEGRVQRFLQ